MFSFTKGLSMCPALAVTIVLRQGLVDTVYASDTDLDLVVLDWDVQPGDPHAVSFDANGQTLTGAVSRPNIAPHDDAFLDSDDARLLAAAEAADEPEPPPQEPVPRIVCELTPRQLITIRTALEWWQESTDDVDGHHQPPTSPQPLPHADIDLLLQELAG